MGQRKCQEIALHHCDQARRRRFGNILDQWRYSSIHGLSDRKFSARIVTLSPPLNTHLSSLPGDDARSRAILEQMRIDEGVHATTAIESGAVELPQPVKRLMTATARIMTETAYRI